MTKVADIMTAEVVTIRNSASITDAIRLMQQRAVHALIVEKINDSDAYGIVTARDIVAKVIAFGRDPARVRVYEIMTKPCIVLNPNLSLENAARLLSQHNLNSAPVIQSKLLGILSITDILERSNLDHQPQVLVLSEKIKQLSSTARQTCTEKGPGSRACAEAWSAVDAVQAELARQQTQPLHQVASEEFWAEYPEAFGDREYDEWCSG